MFKWGRYLFGYFASRGWPRFDQRLRIRQTLVTDILCAVFLGFLALLGFACLVSSAVNNSELMPALVAISV
jgi:hypothetical protein